MSSHKAPQGYQPTGQGAADSGYQAGAGNIAKVGQDLSSSVIPGFAGVTSAVQNNPFYTQAQTGANDAAAAARNFVAPSQFYGAAQDLNTGTAATGAAADALKQGQQGYNAAMGAIPTYTQGHNYAPGILQDALSKAGISWDEAQGLMRTLIPGNLGAANSVLDTAFDPQKALYDRSYQQMLEQQNAISSQNGVSGSPFAAGLAGDASRNFNIDWQNAQLQRQIAGLGAYDSAMTTDASNFSTLSGAGTGTYTGLTNSGVGNFNSLMAGDVGNMTSLMGAGQNALNSGYSNFNSLSGTGMNAFAGASDLGATGLNTMSTAAQLPNDVYMQQQAQILQALQAQVQGTNASMDLTQTATGDYGNYMKIGQGATQLAQNATSINNASSAATWQGIGQLAGLAMAPFTGGSSLALAAAAGGH